MAGLHSYGAAAALVVRQAHHEGPGTILDTQTEDLTLSLSKGEVRAATNEDSRCCGNDVARDCGGQMEQRRCP